MRVACTARPAKAVALRSGLEWALRMLGMGAMLLLLLVPALAAGLAPGLASAATHASPVGLAGTSTGSGSGALEGGACGEDEEFEELIDCGADLEAQLDEPYAITVLRKTEVRTTRAQCEELLADIWARQTCTAGGRECGKLLPGAMPSPGPKLATGSASGQMFGSTDEVDPAQARRLGFPAAPGMPKPRDLLPPVPPPKLAAR